MWVQQMSKLDILKVHKVASEETEADVPTKHVSKAILDMMSESTWMLVPG